MGSPLKQSPLNQLAGLRDAAANDDVISILNDIIHVRDTPQSRMRLQLRKTGWKRLRNNVVKDPNYTKATRETERLGAVLFIKERDKSDMAAHKHKFVFDRRFRLQDTPASLRTTVFDSGLPTPIVVRRADIQHADQHIQRQLEVDGADGTRREKRGKAATRKRLVNFVMLQCVKSEELKKIQERQDRTKSNWRKAKRLMQTLGEMASHDSRREADNLLGAAQVRYEAQEVGNKMLEGMNNDGYEVNALNILKQTERNLRDAFIAGNKQETPASAKNKVRRFVQDNAAKEASVNRACCRVLHDVMHWAAAGLQPDTTVLERALQERQEDLTEPARAKCRKRVFRLPPRPHLVDLRRTPLLPAGRQQRGAESSYSQVRKAFLLTHKNTMAKLISERGDKRRATVRATRALRAASRKERPPLVDIDESSDSQVSPLTSTNKTPQLSPLKVNLGTKQSMLGRLSAVERNLLWNRSEEAPGQLDHSGSFIARKFTFVTMLPKSSSENRKTINQLPLVLTEPPTENTASGPNRKGLPKPRGSYFGSDTAREALARSEKEDDGRFKGNILSVSAAKKKAVASTASFRVADVSSKKSIVRRPSNISSKPSVAKGTHMTPSASISSNEQVDKVKRVLYQPSETNLRLWQQENPTFSSTDTAIHRSDRLHYTARTVCTTLV